MALELEEKPEPKGKPAEAKPEGVVHPKPIAKAIVEPSVRVFTRWTPQRIEYAEVQAEGGDLGQAVLLCDWLLKDDAVRAALGARVDAVLSLDVSFEPADGKPEPAPTPVAPKPAVTKPGELPEAPPEPEPIPEPEPDPIMDAIEEDWDLSYPENELAQVLTWGLLLGVAPWRHETVLDLITDRLLPCPRFYHPGTLTQDRQTEIWKVRDIAGVEYIVDAGQGEWGLFTPYGKRRPWASGMCFTLALLVLIKHYARQDWARCSEKSALLVATTMLDKDGQLPAGMDQKVDIVGKLSARGGDAAVAMPAGWELTLLQTADNFGIYQEQIKMINDAIATVIRGGNLTTHTEGGSKAAAETQAETGDAPKRKADGKALSTMLRSQSVVWWAAWNFGVGADAPWPLWNTPNTAPDVNYFSFANGLSTLQEMGFELDVEVLKSDYGLTFIKGFDPGKADRSKALDVAAKAAQFGAKSEGPGKGGGPFGG
jgi:hypothetical protein